MADFATARAVRCIPAIPPSRRAGDDLFTGAPTTLLIPCRQRPVSNERTDITGSGHVAGGDKLITVSLPRDSGITGTGWADRSEAVHDSHLFSLYLLTVFVLMFTGART